MENKKQILLTIVLLISSIIFFSYSEIDMVIQDKLFDTQTQTWLLDKDLQPYKFIFYDGIKKLLIIIAISFLIALIFFRDKEIIYSRKKAILTIILSAILVPLIVGGLKRYTNMPCPKNEIHYGGKYIKTKVWEKYPPKYKAMKKIKCWPAGHASGGFALLSLVFLFNLRRAKIITIISTLGIAWSMGIYKMLIGDHFFSHTVITMLIAWLIIITVNQIIIKYINFNTKKKYV